MAGGPNISSTAYQEVVDNSPLARDASQGQIVIPGASVCIAWQMVFDLGRCALQR